MQRLGWDGGRKRALPPAACLCSLVAEKKLAPHRAVRIGPNHFGGRERGGGLGPRPKPLLVWRAELGVWQGEVAVSA